MHGIYYADIINRQFGDYFTKQMNSRNILDMNIMYKKASTDVKSHPTFFREKWGDEVVVIMKWTFNNFQERKFYLLIIRMPV